jgi:putative sterol carrier protein
MDTTTQFFDNLAHRGHIPLLEKAKGSVRFDITDDDRTDHYVVTLDTGDISVSREMAPADCVITTDRVMFEDIAKGEQNAMAALLRGSLQIEGDPRMAVLIQRLFSAPSDARSQ